jgi:hypothetical protein
LFPGSEFFCIAEWTPTSSTSLHLKFLDSGISTDNYNKNDESYSNNDKYDNSNDDDYNFDCSYVKLEDGRGFIFIFIFYTYIVYRIHKLVFFIIFHYYLTYINNCYCEHIFYCFFTFLLFSYRKIIIKLI